MNKTVQILILFALFPMIGTAREETMEERKQRIVRKYLRERMTITQSDMVVPSDLPPEDERIADSEKFKGAEVDLQKQDGAPQVVVPPRPPAPRPVPRADSNWLLGDLQETTDANDPFADPFADPYASANVDSGDDLWSWGNNSRNTEPDRRDPYRYDPYNRDDSRRGVTDGRSQQGYASDDRSGFTFGSSGYSSRTDPYNRQQNGQTTYNSSLNLQGNRPRTYGSDPTEGLLSSPFSQFDRSSYEEKRNREAQRYQPYKSPYQQQREERYKQRGTVPKQEEPEFKRPDTYQQWKDRNKTWDPTADDAYINEMMQQNRR